jgi:hypothetical protein
MKRFRLLMLAHAAQCAALIGALPCSPYVGCRDVAGIEFLNDVDAIVEELSGGAGDGLGQPPSGGGVLEVRRHRAADRGQPVARIPDVGVGAVITLLAFQNMAF